MATYYVSPTGNDTTGTGAIGYPWRTINKAVSVVAAGDTVYLRGGTYDERAYLSKSGTESAPITWQPASNECVTIAKGIRISGSWNVIRNVTVSPGWPAGTDPASEGAPAAHIAFEGTAQHNSIYNLKMDSKLFAGSPTMNAVAFRGYSSGVKYNLIDGFDFTRMGGVVFTAGNTNNTVKNGNQHDMARGGFSLEADYSTIENVNIYTNGQYDPQNSDCDAININGNNCVIRGVRTWDIRMRYANRHTDCIQWWNNANDLLIENCVFGSFRNYGGDFPQDQGHIQFETYAGKSCNNVTIRNNIFLSAGNYSIRSSPGQLRAGAADNWKIHNNLFRQQNGVAIRGDLLNVVAGWDIKNNIFYAQENYGTNYAANSSDYNVYVGAKPTNTGYDANSVAALGSVAALAFVNGDTSVSTNYGQDADWRLSASSPCVNSGTATGTPTTDMAGATRDAAPDAGPLEYSSEAPVAQTAIFSSGGVTLTATAPLTFGPLNAATAEVSEGKAVVVKTPAGFVSTGSWSIDGSGASDAKFQLSRTSDFVGAPAYGAALTATAVIDATTGVTFYVRAKAASGETAQNDTSVSFAITGEVVAA